MSTETAQADALDMLRAGLTPDPSQMAAKHSTSLYGAESAIYAAMDTLAARMPRPKAEPSKRGVLVRVCQRRKKADDVDRFVAGLPRTPEQAKP